MLHWSVNASASLHHFHHFFSLHGKLYFLQSTTYEELDEDDYVDLEEEENNFRSPHRDPITQAGGQKLWSFGRVPIPFSPTPCWWSPWFCYTQWWWWWWGSQSQYDLITSFIMVVMMIHKYFMIVILQVCSLINSTPLQVNYFHKKLCYHFDATLWINILKPKSLKDFTIKIMMATSGEKFKFRHNRKRAPWATWDDVDNSGDNKSYEAKITMERWRRSSDGSQERRLVWAGRVGKAA